MNDQTRNNVLIFCAVALTLTVCLVAISNELDKRRVIKSAENFLTETSKNIENAEEQFLQKILKQKNSKNNELVNTNKLLSKRLLKTENELKALKKRFAVQIKNDNHKNKIKWSDGSSEPKYNQTQDGINWSK